MRLYETLQTVPTPQFIALLAMTIMNMYGTLQNSAVDYATKSTYLLKELWENANKAREHAYCGGGVPLSQLSGTMQLRCVVNLLHLLTGFYTGSKVDSLFHIGLLHWHPLSRFACSMTTDQTPMTTAPTRSPDDYNHQYRKRDPI